MPKFPKSNKFSKKFKKRTPFKEAIDFVSMGKSGTETKDSGSFIDPSKYFTDYSKKNVEKMKGGEEKEETVQ